jgi:hypothetical protein
LLFVQLAIAQAAPVISSPQPTGWWATTRAVSFGVAFWIGIEPHYGAFFPGMNGRNPHFLGSGGDAATCGSSGGCIAGWNWWGNYYHVLLIPKGGWLLQQVPGGDRWQATSYQADMWIG